LFHTTVRPFLFLFTRRSRYPQTISVALIFAMLAAAVSAQDRPPTEFQPRVGQAGKDVIWVPTPQELVEKMLELAKAEPGDFLVDLGSGDGRTVITAAKHGIRAHGIEYNPEMVELSKRNAAKAGVSGKATFEKADLFETDLSRATVITMFLLPEINLKLRPRILNLNPGTRIVSITFTMGEWVPDEYASVVTDCANFCTALLWIVPAKAEGVWQFPGGELTLKQEYQVLSGTLKSGTDVTPIANGKLHGDHISFNAAGVQYFGRVIGNEMGGTVSTGGEWTARRASRPM
jgi:hypothetical protein